MIIKNNRAPYAQYGGPVANYFHSTYLANALAEALTVLGNGFLWGITLTLPLLVWGIYAKGQRTLRQAYQDGVTQTSYTVIEESAVSSFCKERGKYKNWDIEHPSFGNICIKNIYKFFVYIKRIMYFL